MNHEALFAKIDLLRDRLLQNKDTIKVLLGKYEPYEVAEDEILRSISALEGARGEFAETRSLFGQRIILATFVPLNLPLYSLVLFAVIPGLFASRVLVRAPSVMQPIIQELYELLDIQKLMPELVIKNVSRAVFMRVYAESADVILFTGRYENALTIQQHCPEALLIFNGGGVNPAIVFENANIKLAADKIAEMRTFNSGQDCAGTDAIFVHESVYGAFLQRLEARLNAIKVGPYGNPNTDVGPILKQEYVQKLVTFLDQQKKYIVRQGRVDLDASIVHPTVIVKSVTEHAGGFHEFFAPVFYILTFKNSEELAQLLLRPIIQDYTMYVTYFGDNPIVSKIKKAQLLHNCIINDVEQGNHAYGGFGEKANFVAFGDTAAARPILISHEVYRFYLNDGIAPLETLADGNIQHFKAVLNNSLIGAM